MHFQSRNPLRERDHRIAGMPLARTAVPAPILPRIALAAVLVVLGVAWSGVLPV